MNLFVGGPIQRYLKYILFCILFMLLRNHACFYFSCKCSCLISSTGHDKNAKVCGQIINDFHIQIQDLKFLFTYRGFHHNISR